MALFHLEGADTDGVHQIKLSGEFDLAALPQAERALEDALDTCRSIEVDLRGLTYIDSSGIRALTVAWEQSRTMVGEFSIIPGPPAVQRVFEITGLTDILPFATEPSAGETEGATDPVSYRWD